MADISREALDVLVYSQRDRMVEAERCARELQAKLRETSAELASTKRSRERYVKHSSLMSDEVRRLERSNASLRGHLTRLRRKLKAVPDA